MDKRISDTPQYKQLADQMKVLGIFSAFFPFLFTKKQRMEIKQLKSKLDQLRKLPDQFNALFLKRGWICYDNMNADLLKRCVELGVSGDIENAEQELINYYQGDISYLVFPLINLPGFKERYELFGKALEDYRARRYHACVPVFLMIIDGAVNQVQKRNKGLFADGVDLVLYDSMVGHESGLAALIKIMSGTRKKTNVEEITIPYRNGILHGMDLGYDNVYVATKTLAAIFAVAEWIRHYHNENRRNPIEIQNPTFVEFCKEMVESTHKMQQLEVEKKLLKEWQPRDFTNMDFASLVPEIGSPEYILCKFFDYYSRSNYGRMASLLTGFKNVSDSKMAGEVRSRLKDIKCNRFQIINIKDVAAAVSEIYVAVFVMINGAEKRIDIKARLLYEVDKVSCKPLIRGVDGGEWFVLDSIISEISNKSLF